MIKVSALSHRYGTGNDDRRAESPPALENIDLAVEPGEFVALIGPSGCGKTTLLNILAGLEAGYVGKIEIDGRAPEAGRQDVATMFARDCLLPWRTAKQNAALGLEVRGTGRGEREQAAVEALERIGLGPHAGQYPSELSQGMRQRVALARVFVTAPKVLLMDEPFSALDAQTRLAMHDLLLQEWRDRGTTVILITHDIGEAITLADRVLVITKGPGRIKSETRLELGRPRTAAGAQESDEYAAYFERLWEDLKDEIQPAGIPA